MSYICKCIIHDGVGYGARLRAPEAERINKFCLVQTKPHLIVMFTELQYLALHKIEIQVGEVRYS